jgi:FMN phosphatase YigB (HAD superfamily)
MTQKTILTDADGVLFHWNAAFNLFMHEQGFPQVPDTEDNYSLAKRHGVTWEDGRRLVTEFNHSDYIRDLHPFADARRYVKQLHEEGYDFIVVTSLSDDPRAYSNRAHNLKKHYGKAIKELHCLPIGIHKGETLERWKDTGLFWIEDHVENAAAGADLGLRSIVIDHPYNTKYIQHDHKFVARVNYAKPWEAIYNIITGAYGAN